MKDPEPELRCAYLVSRYPYVSHTFVLREVHALRARGAEVHTATVRRTPAEDLPSEVERAEARITHALLPTPARQFARTHRRAWRRGRRAYARTLLDALRDAMGGPRTLLWQAFYFAEAVLLWEWMDELGLRQVHAHHANVASDVAMLAQRLAGRLSGEHRPWSFTLHGPTELADVSGHNLQRKAERADAVICISFYARAQVMGLLAPVHWPKLQLVRCGVEPEAFASRDRAEPSASFSVLTVARLEPRKGVAVLLDALERLRADGLDIRLTIAGDGPDRVALEAVVARRGLEAAVTMLGTVDQETVRRLCREADAFCLPSLAEGVPVVLMEGMAAGLPVIATRIAGIPELVEHEETGLLVAPGSAEELAAALARLESDGALRRSLGEAGRERVRADYDVANSAERLERIFTRLARAGDDASPTEATPAHNQSIEFGKA